MYIYIYMYIYSPSLQKMIRQLDIENVKVWQGLTGLMTGLVDSSPLSTTLGSAVASTPEPSFMTARCRSSSAFSAAGDDRDDMASGRNTIPFWWTQAGPWSHWWSPIPTKNKQTMEKRHGIFLVNEMQMVGCLMSGSWTNLWFVNFTCSRIRGNKWFDLCRKS